MVKALALLLGVVLPVSACGSDGSAGLPDDAVVTYQFNDASVPPQYHRSYLVTVTRGETSIVVDSYGEVLAEEKTATPDAVWDDLSSGLAAIEALDPRDSEDGCVGGTSVDVAVVSQKESIVDFYVPECGGSNEDAGQAVQQWIAPARDLFPPMSELAPES